MRSFLLALCALGLLALVPVCPAQTTPAADKGTPFLYVYAAKDAGALPRIALGMERPALKISALASCALIAPAENAKLAGVAVQLNPADAKVLTTTIKEVAASTEASDSPNVVLFFATPDNKALGFLSLENQAAEHNLFKSGVIGFYPEEQPDAVRYLTEKLHPK